MKTEELQKALKLLGGLFPMQITEEQIKFLRDQIKDLPFEAAEKAIRQHRATHEFLKFPQLLEGCRACAFEQDAARVTSGREGSWCDVYRRQAPYLAGRCDLEAALRIHRGWWVRAKSGIETRNSEMLKQAHASGDSSQIKFITDIIEYEKEPYLRKFRSSCKSVLIGTGVPIENAEAWTETIFDPDPHYFQQVLDDLRTNHPASSCA